MWAVYCQSSQLKHAHVCSHPFFFLSQPVQLSPTHTDTSFSQTHIYTHPFSVVQNQLCWNASRLCVGTAGWRAIVTHCAF